MANFEQTFHLSAQKEPFWVWWKLTIITLSQPEVSTIESSFWKFLRLHCIHILRCCYICWCRNINHWKDVCLHHPNQVANTGANTGLLFLPNEKFDLNKLIWEFFFLTSLFNTLEASGELKFFFSFMTKFFQNWWCSKSELIWPILNRPCIYHASRKLVSNFFQAFHIL